MTLRDKIALAGNYSLIIEEEVEAIEKIADYYAVEFAEFVQFNSELWICYSRKQLLEIFKKEKGL